ncbi:hypothetical protein [Winogradskyella vidalii]|uniref:hypothetical protein n=1 Tax=Winogradskyella vidalii TaxID=2615024 RepID=UPI0015CCE36E|nr:hypothetical protein [Winogradskyella vidalii]
MKSEFCFSQQTVNLTNIDLIIYNKDDINLRLFEEKNINQFIEVYLEFNDNFDNIFISTDLEYDNIDDIVTLEEIKLAKNDVILHLNQIKETNINDLLKYEIEINNNWFKYGEDTNKLILKFINKSLSVIQELYFNKKEFSGGIGSSRTYRETDNEEKWRVYNAKYFTTIDLDLGNNKHIYLLNDGDSQEFLFLPLIENDYLISDDDGISSVKKTLLYKTNYLETFERYDYEEFATLLKNKNNNYELVNTFNENLLKAEYDTIMHNQFFIIGKNKKQIDIFNSYYEKIEIDSVKSAYLYRSGLEILTNKGASYYDSELKIIDKFPPKSYSLCGTVSYKKYIVEYDKYEKSHIIKRIKGSAFSNQGKRKDFKLEGVKKRDVITFLNNSNITYRDGNSNFTGEKFINPNYLIVTRRNRSGIYKYEYGSSKYDTIADITNPFIYFPETIKNEVILPINYKSITYNPKDGLVYFYKKNKVGIFPRHKTVQYQNINQETNSFYRITRERRKGWLDINTNIEYYDN